MYFTATVKDTHGKGIKGVKAEVVEYSYPAILPRSKLTKGFVLIGYMRA